ncbi:MAG: PASTA domain-containing protein [Chloroflexota bacterium]|nr:PASTA domain-containing protein [Chloroflexota bacterium]MDE2897094.1 PASTA domain-containing protein [Chloroflexota bacterium]
MSTAVERRRRRARRVNSTRRPRQLARRTVVPVWGLALALGAAAIAFMLVLAAVVNPLAGLQNLADDAVALLQPGAPAPSSDEPLVPRREDPNADVVDVPLAVNLDAEEAKDLLEAAGLEPRVEEAFDDRVAAGLVIRQDPAAGSSVQRLTPVIVTVSRGPSLAPLPNVVGLPVENARATLDRGGFQVIEVAAFNEDVPAGTVLGQEPLAGAVVDRRSVVVMQISRGVEIVPVPPVIGRAEDDARRAIELVGLAVGETTYVEDDSAPNGVVVGQVPASGEGVPSGSEMQLSVVRIGEVVVPELAGVTVDAAERTLFDNGLLVGSIRLIPTPGAAGEIVVGQEPGPGAKVARGYGVRLIVAIPGAAPSPAPAPAASG